MGHRVIAHAPQWMDSLDAGLQVAARVRRAVAIKPTGQGYGPMDNW